MRPRRQATQHVTDKGKRRGWDSNPRWSYPHSGFRDRPVQPLQHLSETKAETQIVRALDRQPQPRFAATPTFTVREYERTAVRVGDLAAQNQTDARTSGFGGKERNKKVGGVGEPRAFVLNVDVEIFAGLFPSQLDASAAFE